MFVTDADNREVLEYDGSSGAILRWYAYGLGSNNVLNQSNVAAGTRSALIPDVQGSIIATLDSGTATLTKAGYLPYGKSANAPSSFGYTAQRIDPETNGLYYYRTRHYSPLIGRFLQTDPSGTKGGVNLYAYAKNDPLNLVDITGKAPDAPNSSVAPVSSGSLRASEEIDSPEEEQTSETTAGGSGALVPMAEAAYNTGTIRTIAGYSVGGNAGLVGSTYNMNIWGLFATEQSQGLGALADAINSEANAAGALNISITGNAIVNPAIANMNPAIAARFGLSFYQVNPTTIILQGLVQ